MKYTLGIDIGTTSVKVIMISSEGKIFAETSVPHDLISMHPNWAEEDADIWWENTRTALQRLKEAHSEEMKDIKCYAGWRRTAGPEDDPAE